jgi:paraquat-inducible protein B
MSEQVSYFRLGLFVLVTLGLIVAGVVVLGAGALMKQTLPAETYLNESVTGLDVGAPVKYLGVQVGKVSKIGFVAEKYTLASDEQQVQFGKYILVEVAIDLETMPKVPGTKPFDLLQKRVAAGMRVRLQSSLTGPAYIAVDYLDPNVYKPLPVAWKPQYAYVPSAPGTMGQMMSAVERLASEIEKAQISKLVDNINTLAVDVDKAVNSLQVADISKQGVELLAELRGTNKRLVELLANPGFDKGIADVVATVASLKQTVTGSEKELRATLADLPVISARLRTSSESIDGILSSTEMKRILAGLAQASDNAGPVTVDLAKVARRLDSMLTTQQRNIELLLTSLRKVAENVEAISEDAKQNPSRVILGNPPQRLKPGETK